MQTPKQLRRTAGLYCLGNEIETLDLSLNTALKKLNCRGNYNLVLDLSKNTNITWLDYLEYLNCESNHLTKLDLSRTAIGCGKNEMPLSCRMESLKTLYLKTGWVINYITVDRFGSFIHENTVIEYKD